MALEEMLNMKATGIVRRIDDLGRVVIPKEIRKTLKIREGNQLEIFTDRNGEIVLKKYSPIGELGAAAKQFADSLSNVCGCTVIIVDRDSVCAATGGNKKELIGKIISKSLEEVLMERESILPQEGKKSIRIIEEDDYGEGYMQIVLPILWESDVAGGVILMPKKRDGKLESSDEKIAKLAAEFLGKQMEN